MLTMKAHSVSHNVKMVIYQLITTHVYMNVQKTVVRAKTANTVYVMLAFWQAV